MRDYQKDLEICERATKGPWNSEKMAKQVTDKRIASEFIVKAADGTFAGLINITDEDAEFIAITREALPHYIKRCMELEEALQYYANPKSYRIGVYEADGSISWASAPADKGQLARKVLGENALKERD